MNINNNRRKILRAGMASLLTGFTGMLVSGCKETEKLINAGLASPHDIAFKNSDFNNEAAIRDNLLKVKHFNRNFAEDIYLSYENKAVLKSTLARIQRVQHVIGYANFNLLAFDDMLRYARRYPQIGQFHKSELNFIDEIFFYDARNYGFFGNKVIKELTAKINKKEMVKIPGSGHYLFKQDALTKFKQLKNDIGPELILTSGVRSVVKQLQLFLMKVEASKGNLSLASRSLAPPGHSYHGVGDFDVGKKGFGRLNFTSRFSDTMEYKKLIELKYIDLRYTKENKVGVRYEPWHIKVV